MDQPFIGSEAIASGALERRYVRRYCRAIMPNVYLDRRVDPSLRQRTVAAWLWSGREAVVGGLAAAGVHGSKWIDDDASIELIWKNARAPQGCRDPRRPAAARRIRTARRPNRYDR
ncbi:MAG: hypothetical protein ACXWEI_16300 [Mycobacterium sp.]